MIAAVIRREGGYVHHAADRGGPTHFGITQATLSRHLGHAATERDVIELEPEAAAAIYRMDYYDAPKIGMLPEPWQELVFDWGVNSGPSTAIRELQRLCQAHGYDPGLIDGVIGPKTAAAAAKLLNTPQKWYIKRRREFYQRIVAADPSQGVFLAGWLNRLDGLMS